MIYLLEDLAVKDVGVLYWISWPWDVKDLTPWDVKDLTFTWVEILFQASSFERSCCRVLQSFLLSTVKYIAVSSAKGLTCEWICSGRSLYIIKTWSVLGNPWRDRDMGWGFPLLMPHTVCVPIEKPWSNLECMMLHQVDAAYKAV